jgi:hypothetical protein
MPLKHPSGLHPLASKIVYELTKGSLAH